MLKRYSVNYALLAMAMDAALTATALALTRLLSIPWLMWVWPGGWYYEQGRFLSPSLWPIVAIGWLIIFIALSVYDPKRNYNSMDEVQHVIVATLFADLTLSGILYMTQRDLSRWLFVLFVLLHWSLLLGWRGIAYLVFRMRRTGPVRSRPVLIVGAGDVGCHVAHMLTKEGHGGLVFMGYLDDDPEKLQSELPVLGSLDDTERIVKEYDIEEVVIALPSRAWKRMNQLVATLHAYPVHVHIIPDYFAITLWRAAIDDFVGIPMIDLRAPALNDYQRLVKRAFDLVIGSIFTIFFLPLMAIIALAIKIDSSGPVFFKQPRVGENGRIFHMYKFRSMVEGADKRLSEVIRENEDGTISFKRKEDPRVTRVGRFLRKSSLDELPQFFNILKGEMSLVGPRPEMPMMVDHYEPWQRKRFAAPQGLTGWWQINGRSDKEMHLHTDEDLYYLQNYSLWLDIVILARTVVAVLKGRGAY